MPIAPQVTNTPVDITSADFAITAVSHTSSTATYTASGHTFSAGDTVIISGIVPAGYSGTFTISSVVAGTSFTCANTTNLAVTTATGDAFTANNTDFAYADVQQVYQADIIDVTTATSAASAAAAAAQATANAAAATAGTAQSTATAAQSSATTAYNTAIGSLQPSANTIVNSSNQITAIASNGITVYSGSSATSGARVVMNSTGLAGYDASNNATFSITASTGAANFSGSITGSTITGGSLNIAGNTTINYLGNGILIASGATITGTINAQAGYFGTTTNGFSITSTGLTGVGTGTISGGTIKTAGSSNWVQMAGSTNSMDFYVSGSSVGHIVPLGAGGVLMHYGTTADPSATTYPFAYVGAGGAELAYSSAIYLGAGSSGVVLQGATAINGNTLLTGQLEVTGNLQIDAVAAISSPTSTNFDTLIYNKTGTSGTLDRVYRVNNLSSAQYKDNITYFPEKNYTNIVSQMKPITFTYKPDQVEDPQTVVMGLLAEDIDAIDGAKELVDYLDGKPNAIRYEKIPLFIIKAISEINNRLAKLEGK